MKRLFIAINLPDQIKEEIEKKKNEIMDLFPEGCVKWVKKENLHITVLFIGNGDIGSIKNDIEKIEEEFKIEGGPIKYDNQILPRNIWIPLSVSDNLMRVAKNIGNYRFKPHITLGRVRMMEWRRINPEERPQFEEEIDFSFKTDRIDLMESILKKEGPEYIKL